MLVKTIIKEGKNVIQADIIDKEGHKRTVYITEEEEKQLREGELERAERKRKIEIKYNMRITNHSAVRCESGEIKKWCTGWMMFLPLNSQYFNKDDSQTIISGQKHGWSCQSKSWKDGKDIINVLDGKTKSKVKSKAKGKAKDEPTKKIDKSWNTNKFSVETLSDDDLDVLKSVLMEKARRSI